MTKSINDTSLFTKKKFISVVTINFNNDKGLERTIDSVKEQINYQDIDFWFTNVKYLMNSMEISNACFF